MYNKATGRYKPLFDGNVHALLNIYWSELIAGTARLVLPFSRQIDKAQAKEFAKLFPAIWANRIEANYTGNAQQQRRDFWECNGNKLIACDSSEILVTSLGNMPLRFLHTKPIVYYCNVSKQRGIQQPCDEWLQADKLLCSKAQSAYCYDSGQLAYLPDNVELVQKDSLFNDDYYDAILASDDGDDFSWWAENYILVPFRLSDKTYGFNLEALSSSRRGPYIVTDPNNTYEGVDRLAPNVLRQQFTKAEYIRLLFIHCRYALYKPDSRIYHMGMGELDKASVKLIAP